MLTVPIRDEAVPTIIFAGVGIFALWYGYRRAGKSGTDGMRSLSMATRRRNPPAAGTPN